MVPRASLRLGVAVTLVLLGIALPLAFRHWLQTRTVRPLDMHVSLERGRLQTKDFYINFTDQYAVSFEIDDMYEYRDPRLGCERFGPDSVLKTHLRLYRDGNMLGETDGAHYYGYTAGFDANKTGYYRLDVDVLSDASCLNARHPRIVVHAVSGDYYTYSYFYGMLRWLGLAPVLGGIGLAAVTATQLLRKRTQGRHHGEDRLEQGLRDNEPKNLSLVRRPERAFSVLPSFGFFCATFLSFFVLLFIADRMNRPVPMGLWVSILRTPINHVDSGLIPPLVLSVERAGLNQPSRLYLNGALVPWTDLQNALKQQLKVRAEWVVYVQGDPDLPFHDVAGVVDVIHGLHARVVLLTSVQAHQNNANSK